MLDHVTGGAEAETFQPMNVNFGLMPPLPGRTKKADRKQSTPTGRASTWPNGSSRSPSPSLAAAEISSPSPRR